MDGTLSSSWSFAVLSRSDFFSSCSCSASLCWSSSEIVPLSVFTSSRSADTCLWRESETHRKRRNDAV